MSSLDSEDSSIHTQSQSVYTAVPPPSKATKAEMQRRANLKFETTNGRGITYKDLLKPKYRLANTIEQAQRILRYHKNKGNLFTNNTKTIPQEYFSSPEDAQLAQMKNNLEKSSIHTEPMGVVDNTPSFNEPIEIDSELERELELARKQDALTLAILNAGNGRIPVSMHNIHIHVNLPSQCVDEVYNFRLRHKPPSQTRQKDKRLEIRLDRFLVTCRFFPESPTVIITIPCSEAPFLLSPVPIGDTNNRLTSLFKDFASQIRGVMCVDLRDTTGAIIPPIDSSRWRFIQADLGWDTPITPKQYRVMTNVQLTTFNDIVLQIYKKRISGHYFARVEERNHQFSNQQTTTSFDNDIGPKITEAFKSAQTAIREEYQSLFKGQQTNEQA